MGLADPQVVCKRGFHGTLGTMAKSATDTCSKLLEITRDN